MALRDSAGATSSKRSPARRWQVWVGAAALFFLSWISGGYQFYAGNHALQIPLVESLVDPSLFPGDPFAATLRGYSAPLWWAVARATSFLPFERLFFLLFVVEKVCLLLAAASLARALRPESAVAPWAGALVAALGIPPLLGNGKITASYFEQTAFSIPFFLWGFASILRGARWRWAVFSAIGTTLNPMYGVYALTYSALAAGLIHYRRWPRWILPLFLFAALASPAFAFAIRSGSVQAPDWSLWLSAVAARFPHHLSPLEWEIERFVAFGLLMMVVISAVLRAPAAEERGANDFIAAAAICALGWLALAFFARYLLHSPILLVLHPARATDFWYAAAAIFLAAHYSSQAELGGRAGRAKNLVSLAISILLLPASALLMLNVFIGAPLLLFLDSLPWETWGRRVWPPRTVIVLALLGVCFTTGWLVASWVSPSGRRLYSYGVSPGEREVALWAKAHTPRNALFAVPPNMEFFRALSERGVVGTWKDGSAILWDKAFVSEWVERMHALGRPVVPERANLWPAANSIYPAGWHDSDLESLCRRFGADYCVLPKTHPTRWPVLFRGKMGFMIVKRPLAQSSDSD